MPRLLFLLALGSASLLTAIPIAKGAQTCTGTIRTSSIHPVTKGATITSSRGLQDTANPDLSSRFMEGVRRSGVRTGNSGGAVLTLSAEVVAPSGAHVIQSGRHSGFSNFDWMQRLPSSPEHTPLLRGATLTMSVQVSDKSSSSIAWIANVHCRVTTDDPGALAEELGMLIGSSLGKNSYPRSL